MSTTIEIKEVKNRGVLSEGRNNGMAFAFLQKVSDNTYETVQPFSPCKDYLNEVIITENYDVGTKGCGLKYPKKLGLFNETHAYMGIVLLKTKNNYYAYSSSIDNDKKMLLDNHKNLEKMLNDIESDLGLGSLTSIEKANDDYYLVKIPIEWCQSTHAISLYSLLLRLGMANDGKEDYHNFLENYSYNREDRSMWQYVKNKFKLVIDNKKLPPNTINYNRDALSKGMQSPHNNGFQNWIGGFELAEMK